jgi:hypothetical protein
MTNDLSLVKAKEVRQVLSWGDAQLLSENVWNKPMHFASSMVDSRPIHRAQFSRSLQTHASDLYDCQGNPWTALPDHQLMIPAA